MPASKPPKFTPTLRSVPALPLRLMTSASKLTSSVIPHNSVRITLLSCVLYTDCRYLQCRSIAAIQMLAAINSTTNKNFNLLKLLFRLSLLFLIFFSSCKPKHQGEKKTGLLSNLVSITENEDKGIKEIIEFYGGQCEYGVQNKVYTNKDNETNFWLKFSKSASVDSLAKVAELPVSNIAYIFYKNLDKEKSSYNQIQSELIFGDGGTMKFSYTIAQLEKVKSKIQLVDEIVNLIKNKNFKDIKNYLIVDTALFKYDKDILISNLQKADPEFGNASDIIPYGFKFSKAENGQEILHISGLIKRDKQSNYFSINLDPNSLKKEVYSLDYQL